MKMLWDSTKQQLEVELSYDTELSRNLTQILIRLKKVRNTK